MKEAFDGSYKNANRSRATQVIILVWWIFLLHVNHHLTRLTAFQSHLNDSKHHRSTRLLL